jgi:hypothetical protein
VSSAMLNLPWRVSFGETAARQLAEIEAPKLFRSWREWCFVLLQSQLAGRSWGALFRPAGTTNPVKILLVARKPSR